MGEFSSVPVRVKACADNSLGIGLDARRAFTELSQACDRGLSEGVVDLRAAVGTLLSPTTSRAMAKDLAIGLFELSNCYLDGSGTKRQPEMGLEYLRMAGSLGDMAAQEREFVTEHRQPFCTLLTLQNSA